MLLTKYLSAARVACFDGEGDLDTAAKAATAKAAAEKAAADAATAAAVAEKKFTQEDVNRFLAEDKRKYQTQLKQMEEQLNATLQSRTLSEQDRSALQANLEMVQGQMRTKEQQQAAERKQIEESYQQRMAEVEKKASFFEALYRDSTIDRAIQDAAVKHDAFSPSQIVALIRPMTKMVDELDPLTQKSSGRLKPMVEMLGKNATTGESEKQVLTPDEAVQRMKETPEEWGNQFKSNVVSGIGSNSATGGHTLRSNGRIDVRKLTPQQYREIREKNPELLGLAPKSGRR